MAVGPFVLKWENENEAGICADKGMPGSRSKKLHSIELLERQGVKAFFMGTWFVTVLIVFLLIMWIMGLIRM